MASLSHIPLAFINPGYDVKASLPRDASSLDDICPQDKTVSGHGKRSSSLGNGGKRKTVHRPSGVEGTECHKGNKYKRLKLGTGESKLSHLPYDESHLPSEIWHHTFTFISTKDMGILLHVNKLFDGCLDPQSLFTKVLPLFRHTHIASNRSIPMQSGGCRGSCTGPGCLPVEWQV
ncbi:hypothetical protein LX36DRAFT_204261 [Colletotrichum falcatum]|nr:hypothetical protein LX36DRAFT_204261 [Colletotrichum falcatum]